MTRGERNNNPGNIDRQPGVHWVGQSADQSGDPRFVVFDEAKYGIRALAKVLLTYFKKHGLNTVRRIINRWAPPNENDSAAYVNHVAQQLGVGADAQIDLFDGDILAGLVKAIIAHENGDMPYAADVVGEGVRMAKEV